MFGFLCIMDKIQAHDLGIKGFFKCNLLCILMEDGGNGNGNGRVFIRREGILDERKLYLL